MSIVNTKILILPITVTLASVALMAVAQPDNSSWTENRSRLDVIGEFDQDTATIRLDERLGFRDSSSLENTGSHYLYWGAGGISDCEAPSGHPFITLGDGSVCNAGPAIPSWPFGVASAEVFCEEASLNVDAPFRRYEPADICERALGPRPSLVQQCDLTIPQCPASALTANFIYDTDRHDASNPSVTLPLRGAVNVQINWGEDADPSCPEIVTSPGDVTCTYSIGGIKEVAIAGDLQRFGVESNAAFQQKLVEVRDLSQLNGLTSLEGAFRNARNLIAVPDSIPETVITLRSAFEGAIAFNDQNINNWNTERIVNLQSTFRNATAFNQPLDNWDVSSVTTLWFTFYNATAFDQPLDNWDVSSVTNLTATFYNATAFNQPLDNWDVSNVTLLASTFQNATAFDQPLDNWDVSSVTNLTATFYNATAFNQPLDNWDVSNVTSLESTFRNATAFNQSLGSWDTSSAISLRSAFHDAASFNNGFPAGVSDPANRLSWDLRRGVNLVQMFSGAAAFNANIDDWTLMCASTLYTQGIGVSKDELEVIVADHGIDRIYFTDEQQEASYFSPAVPGTETVFVRSSLGVQSMFTDATSFTYDLSHWQIPYSAPVDIGLPASRTPQFGVDTNITTSSGNRIVLSYINHSLPDQPARFDAMPKGVLTPQGYSASGMQTGGVCSIP